jgi:glycosyltransferase involved in cell wall biosynthesis
MPYLRYFEAWWAGLFYAQAVARLRPDIVMVFFAGYGEAVGLTLANLFSPAKVVFVVGYPMELAPHRFIEVKYWGLDRKINVIIIKARHMAPAIEQFFGCKTHLIPNGIDLQQFCPGQIVSSKSEMQQFPNLVTVAALERRKGFEVVLAALPEVIARIGPINYTIVGDGPDRVWLEAQIQARGLTEYVKLIGAVKDVRPYLANGDLFLLPSYGEGLPNAYLEALAMGLPTIVSNDPPYDDIAHPAFSIQIDRHNPETMSQALIQLLSNPTCRAAMRRAARREAEEKYAWPIIAQQYQTLFTELIGLDQLS